MDEMLGEARHHSSEGAIRSQSAPIDISMMVARETHMSKQASNVFPAKGLGALTFRIGIEHTDGESLAGV